MTTRTFKQLGQAFGPEPVTLTVKIDGATVFNGTVPTLNLPVVPATQEETTEVLFEWQRDITFSGVQKLEVTVQGGSVRLEKILANHVLVPNPHVVPALVPGGDRQWATCYMELTEWGYMLDPKTNVKINNVDQPRNFGTEFLGQWKYMILNGDTLTCDVNTWAGTELKTWTSSHSYQEQDIVIHNDGLYFAKQNVPINQDISNNSYWAGLPLPNWSSGRSYGAMTTVAHEGKVYTSRFAVPQGTDVTNHNYWNAYMDDREEAFTYSLA